MVSDMKVRPFSDWGLGALDGPLVIAGPCSAETEEQVLSTARALHTTGVRVFRSGIWKPRTRPGSFEGVGSVGLPWLRKVKEETGMLTAVEVANVKHVYEALRAGVDILWVGARTTVNPFAVQEIADALGNVDIPVMVKNPVNPDVDLWIGAIERLSAVGITRLAGLHRGFSGMEKSRFRNDPQWQVAIELKRRMPQLPMICDPSHISGRRNLIAELSQCALDLGFNGLMIETHCDPEHAWSDAKQQVTPATLDRILSGLTVRRENASDAAFQQQLAQYRSQIDQVDRALMRLLGERMRISSAIGTLKKENDVTVLQTHRWDDILSQARAMGREYDLGNAFVDTFIRAIHEESIRVQETIMNEHREDLSEGD